MFDLEKSHNVMPSEDLGIYTKLWQRDSVSDDVALDVWHMIFCYKPQPSDSVMPHGQRTPCCLSTLATHLYIIWLQLRSLKNDI